MKKLLLLLSFSVIAFAQSAGVGQNWVLLGPTTLQSGAVANGNGTNMAVGGLSSAIFAVNCSVTCSGGTTINFEGSDASTNWAALSAVQVGTATIASAVVNQASGSVTFWQAPIGAFVNIRARISAYSAGTITVTATASAAPYDPKTLNGNLFVGGTTVDSNSGNKSAATVRVVLATDQPALTNKLLVTPDSVALPANQSVNESQINGVTPLMGNGVTGTGSQRVTIASDNTAFSVNATLSAETTKVIGTTRVLGNGGATIDSAPAATAPTNTVQVGGQFVTSPTTLTTGQAGALQLTAAQNLKTDHTTIGGTAFDTNSGNKSAGTQRMVIATDQPNLTTALNVALAANQSVNVAQVGGSNTSTAATGVQKVGVVGNAGAAFDAATGAAPPANGVLVTGLGSGATGGFLTAIPVCDSFFNINISTATTTLAVTGVSGRHVRICSINMVALAADNVGVISGTGATCGTGSAAIIGTTSATGWNFAANGGLTLGSGLGTVLRTVATGDSVCIITSAATQLSGSISYAIY